MPSSRRSPALVAVQGASLIAMTILLIQPQGVPDPFGVGASLSWTLICDCRVADAGRLTIHGGMPRTKLDPFSDDGCFLVVFLRRDSHQFGDVAAGQRAGVLCGCGDN
jgi:hypothetical protein